MGILNGLLDQGLTEEQVKAILALPQDEDDMQLPDEEGGEAKLEDVEGMLARERRKRESLERLLAELQGTRVGAGVGGLLSSPSLTDMSAGYAAPPAAAPAART